MKTAYLVSGLVRDIEFCGENQVQNLVVPLNADVFVCTSDFTNVKIVDEEGYPKEFLMTKLEKDEVRNLCSKVYGASLKGIRVEEDYDYLTGEGKDKRVPWFDSWRQLKSALEAMEKYEKESGVKYSHIAQGRSDLLVYAPITPDLVSRLGDAILVPIRHHHDTELLKKVESDQLAAGKRELMEVYCRYINFYQIFEEETLDILQNNKDKPETFICEYRLKQYLDIHMIKVFPEKFHAYPLSWLKPFYKDKNLFNSNIHIKAMPDDLKKKLCNYLSGDN